MNQSWKRNKMKKNSGVNDELPPAKEPCPRQKAGSGSSGRVYARRINLAVGECLQLLLFSADFN